MLMLDLLGWEAVYFLTFHDHVYRLHSSVTPSACERDPTPVDFYPSDLYSDIFWGESFDSNDDKQPTERAAPVDYAAKLQRCAATLLFSELLQPAAKQSSFLI